MKFIKIKNMKEKEKKKKKANKASKKEKIKKCFKILRIVLHFLCRHIRLPAYCHVPVYIIQRDIVSIGYETY